MNPWLRLVLVLVGSVIGGLGIGCLIGGTWLRRLQGHPAG